MTVEAIVSDGLTCSFGQLTAVDHISFNSSRSRHGGWGNKSLQHDAGGLAGAMRGGTL